METTTGTRNLLAAKSDIPIDRIRLAAKTAHEVIRAYCIGLGDHSQLPWDDALAWQMCAAIDGAHVIAATPGVTCEQSHEVWCEFLRTDGWRWGAAKDRWAKTHPCLVPYSKLPASQRVKDELFGLVVRGVLGL